jgi:hypothetical protein
VSKFKTRSILLVISFVLVSVGVINPFVSEIDTTFAGMYGVFFLILWAFYMIGDRLKSENIVFEAGERFKGFVAITDIISKAKDHINIVDPYCGMKTLLAIDTAPIGIPVRFLTTPHNNDEREKRAVKVQVKVLMEERPEIEIRSVVSKKDNRVTIHDRYILTRPHGYKLGASIKDFGNKQTSIDPMSVFETEEMEGWFENKWEKSYEFFQ